MGIPKIDLGQYLAPGTIVATLQDLETMRVDFSVPEQQLDAAEDRPVGAARRRRRQHADFKGSVTGIEPKVDPTIAAGSGSRRRSTNPEGKLSPGQFVQVRVELPVEKDVIAVPQTARRQQPLRRLRLRRAARRGQAGRDGARRQGGCGSAATPAAAADAAAKPEAEKPALVAKQVFVQVGRRSEGWSRSRHGIAAGDVSRHGRTEPAVQRHRRSPSTTRSIRPRRPAAATMSFSDIFIRRPVLSTVLAFMILLLGLPGSLQPVDPAVSEGRGNRRSPSPRSMPARAPDLIQGFITAPIARGRRDDREHRLRHLAEHALGQRGDGADEARLQSGRRADRGAVQGAAGDAASCRRMPRTRPS